jgi:hypothetical protein
VWPVYTDEKDVLEARSKGNFTMATVLLVLCLLLFVGLACARVRAKVDPKKTVQKLFS